MQFPGNDPRFRDRHDAGQQLAARLAHLADEKPLVFALPRGGVPVGYEVAEALGAPLDVFLVRKLGVPGHEELAMGAIGSGGARVINEDVVRALRLDPEVIDAVAAREALVLERLEQRYRADRQVPDVSGRTIILVDDGLATGATMRAAIQALRAQRPRKLVVAVPVAPPETCDAIRPLVDELVCVLTPRFFYGVGMWYDDFSQTTDEEVRDLLARGAHRPQVNSGYRPGSSAG